MNAVPVSPPRQGARNEAWEDQSTAGHRAWLHLLDSKYGLISVQESGCVRALSSKYHLFQVSGMMESDKAWRSQMKRRLSWAAHCTLHTITLQHYWQGLMCCRVLQSRAVSCLPCPVLHPEP